MNDKRRNFLKNLRSDNDAHDMVVISDGSPFIKALQDKVDSLKETLGVGIDIKNIDDLIDGMGDIKALVEPVNELKTAINGLEIPQMPESVKISGIDELMSELNRLKTTNPKVEVDWINEKGLKQITEKLDKLRQATEKITIKPDQRPENFMPIRKVILLGNKFVFDDSWNTGGGGGGGTRPPDMYYQPIVQSGAGTTNIVGGVSGKRIKVTNYVVVMGGAGSVKWQSAGGDLTGAMSFASNGGVSVGGTEFSPAFQGALSGGLDLITTGAAGNGHIAYFFE